MQDTIEVKRKNVKELLTIIDDSIRLLEEIPEMQDQDRHSEISSIIGGELEAIITTMTEIEKDNHEIRDILNDLRQPREKDSKFADLERKALRE